MSKQKKECDCSKHLAKIGKIVEDTDCPMSICPHCGKVVHIEPYKHKLADGKSFTKALYEYMDGLLSTKLKDALAKKLIDNDEMEYVEMMYDKSKEIISKSKYFSVYFLANENGKSLQEECSAKGLDFNNTRRNAERDAEEIFDILLVYENYVMRLLGQPVEVKRDDSYNTSELSLSTATI